jgi:CheY-like chemotaxis protein
MELKHTILVVEDEHINRELLKIFLEKKYQLTFAADFDTALSYVDGTAFDLIITDIRLGSRLDGIKLLQHVRKGTQNTSTPVVAYTASDTSINQKSFADEGFNDFIAKPVLQDEMLEKIAELIDSK